MVCFTYITNSHLTGQQSMNQTQNHYQCIRNCSRQLRILPDTWHNQMLQDQCNHCRTGDKLQKHKKEENVIKMQQKTILPPLYWYKQSMSSIWHATSAWSLTVTSIYAYGWWHGIFKFQCSTLFCLNWLRFVNCWAFWRHSYHAQLLLLTAAR